MDEVYGFLGKIGKFIEKMLLVLNSLYFLSKVSVDMIVLFYYKIY